MKIDKNYSNFYAFISQDKAKRNVIIASTKEGNLTSVLKIDPKIETASSFSSKLNDESNKLFTGAGNPNVPSFMQWNPNDESKPKIEKKTS